MQNIKPNRAQRRAAQSNGKPKFKASMLRMTSRLRLKSNCTAPDPAPQIAAPSRATRFAGMT